MWRRAHIATSRAPRCVDATERGRGRGDAVAPSIAFAVDANDRASTATSGEDDVDRSRDRALVLDAERGTSDGRRRWRDDRLTTRRPRFRRDR